MEKKVKQKNYQIQFLRGLGCLIVVFYHFYCRYQQIYFNDYSHNFLVNKLGKIGVSLFLLLTGYYLIPREENNPKKYIVKRLKAIYIPYILSIVIIFLISFSGYLGAEREVTLFEFILNIFLINGFINKPYVDGAHWYLTYIFIFTLIMGFIIALNKQRKPHAYIIWVLMSLALCTIAYFIKHPITQELRLLIGGTYAPIVIIGISLRNRIDTTFTKKEFSILICLSYLTILLSRGIFECLIIMALTYIVWKSVNNKLRFFNKFKFIILIGNMSYIIYLIHQNIGYMIMNFFNTNYEINNFALIVLVSFIIFILSYVVKYICDKVNTYI